MILRGYSCTAEVYGRPEPKLEILVYVSYFWLEKVGQSSQEPTDLSLDGRLCIDAVNDLGLLEAVELGSCADGIGTHALPPEPISYFQIASRQEGFRAD